MSIIIWRRLRPLRPKQLRTKWWCINVGIIIFSIIVTILFLPSHSYRSVNGLLQLDFVLLLIQFGIVFISILSSLFFYYLDKNNKNTNQCRLSCLFMYYLVNSLFGFGIPIFALFASSTFNREYLTSNEQATTSILQGVNIVVDSLWIWLPLLITLTVPTIIAHLVQNQMDK